MREAHLIGNGWSMDYETLDSLAGEVCFAMNGIAGAFPKTHWRPTYYLMVTTRYHREEPEFCQSVHQAVEAAERSWIDAQQRSTPFFAQRRDVTFIETHEELKWNNVEPFSKYATAMLTTIQIAAALGYDPLILHGVDGYRAEGRNHFLDNYHKFGKLPTDQNDRIREAYRLALECCPARILDATKSPGFGIFEKI